MQLHVVQARLALQALAWGINGETGRCNQVSVNSKWHSLSDNLDIICYTHQEAQGQLPCALSCVGLGRHTVREHAQH
jgi:hypothetical protein